MQVLDIVGKEENRGRDFLQINYMQNRKVRQGFESGESKSLTKARLTSKI